MLKGMLNGGADDDETMDWDAQPYHYSDVYGELQTFTTLSKATRAAQLEADEERVDVYIFHRKKLALVVKPGRR